MEDHHMLQKEKARPCDRNCLLKPQVYKSMKNPDTEQWHPGRPVKRMPKKAEWEPGSRMLCLEDKGTREA